MRAYSAATATRETIMPSSRPRMIDSAPETIREISSAQVGMSWIRPWTWPADQMPWSGSPVS